MYVPTIREKYLLIKYITTGILVLDNAVFPLDYFVAAESVTEQHWGGSRGMSPPEGNFEN